MTNEELSLLRTPAYVYDIDLLRRTLNTATTEASNYNNFEIHYALKANPDPVIVSIMAKHGLGADCVSGGEVERALECGIPAGKIVYAGVGKTDSEIRLSLKSHIGCFNIESIEELEIINEIAAEENLIAPVALRINPDIDAHTHTYITTGLPDNKFGIPHEHLIEATDIALNKCKNLHLIGLHFHIGSQITLFKPFELLCKRIHRFLKLLKENFDFTPQYINVGGGLGIDYENPMENPVPDFKNFFASVGNHLKTDPEVKVHFELGRSLVGQCGSLYTSVLYTKSALSKKFAIVDAGMNNLIRPALYQAEHAVELISDFSNRNVKPTTYDVVGPICESADTFRTDLTFPVELMRGDVLAIRSAGAYGEAMSSHYNLRSEANKIYLNL